jgi:hypothetical protein
LREVVAAKIAKCDKEVNLDVAHLYLPPSHMATRYRSMWAYGNHL